MSLIADLHIHSPFSRATSKKSDLFGLAAWAHLKGIQLVGTGDFTHPGWMAHLQEHLEPAEPGLFRLKAGLVECPLTGRSLPSETRFLLSAEISSIYKKKGKTRKIHNLLFASSFAEALAINQKLGSIGNIKSDGRPILGLDARDLLEIQLEKAPEGFLVPAHIWTPWFSLFGSKSGFDAIEDCFEDLTPHVFALETGLSSDPEMNRRISALDSYSLISNSDCHSPSKLGREANLFSCELNFFSLRDALKNPQKGFEGTLEFYPDEGKYHLDGHRKCNERLIPADTARYDGLCPACGKPVTVGVLNRVMELADREQPIYQEQDHFESLIPLEEIVSELLGVGVASKKVQGLYRNLLKNFGTELFILRELPPEELAPLSPLLSEALRRLRAGKVTRQGGYDGEYGRILLFSPEELQGESLARKHLQLIGMKEI